MNNSIDLYDFFLFSKLYELYKPSDEPYDVAFFEVRTRYKQWELWDDENGHRIGTYESIEKFLQTLK